MKLKTICLLSLISLNASAADLIFINRSDIEVRIDSLQNKCGAPLVTPESPIRLAPGGRCTFRNITPVIHIYTVCGGGMCSASALGFKNASRYVVDILFSGGVPDLKQHPDHWVGNIDCPTK